VADKTVPYDAVPERAAHRDTVPYGNAIPDGSRPR